MRQHFDHRLVVEDRRSLLVVEDRRNRLAGHHIETVLGVVLDLEVRPVRQGKEVVPVHRKLACVIPRR